MAQQSSHRPRSVRGGKPARRGKDHRETPASAGGKRRAKSSSAGSGQRSAGSPASSARRAVGRPAGAASGAAHPAGAASGAGRSDGAASNAAPSRRKLKDSAGPCPIMRACGGCAWLGIPYRKQLVRKQEAMENLFRPLIERMGWDAVIEATCGMGGKAGDPGKAPAPRAFRYKAATPFAPGPAGAVRSGFFARGTHTIVPAPNCAVEAPGARHILNEVARAAERLGIPAYDEDARQGMLRYAVLRMGWRTDEAMLTIVTARREVPHIEDLAHELSSIDPRIVCVAQNINGREGNAILGRETRVLWGAPHMKDELLGCTFAISPTAFYQTNPQQTEVLYRLAIEGMALEAGDVLLDAYCGSGTIGLCAARDAAHAGKVIKLIGVEKNPAGIADARLNAELNGLGPDEASFMATDATEFLRDAARSGTHVDVVVLDPPRAGSTPAFLTAAAELGPRRIVYISCNPTTQVRDLEILGHQGYRLCRLTPVDMFPHTEHTETVAVLSRKSATKTFIPVTVSPKDMGLDEAKAQPTYENIRKYVKETHGLTVSTLNIAQMKAECGLEMECDRSGGKQQPKCPPEKREAILDAFRHFGMIEDDSSEG